MEAARASEHPATALAGQPQNASSVRIVHREVSLGSKMSEATKKNQSPVSYTKRNRKAPNYDGPLGKLLIAVGTDVVNEYLVQDVENSSTLQTMHTPRPKLYSCYLCGYKSESRLVIFNHMQDPHWTYRNTKHGTSKQYYCNLCSFSCPGFSRIDTHMKFCHLGNTTRHPHRAIPPPGSNMYDCSTCMYEATRKQDLVAHEKLCRRNFEQYKMPYNQGPERAWDLPAKMSVSNVGPRSLTYQPHSSAEESQDEEKAGPTVSRMASSTLTKPTASIVASSKPVQISAKYAAPIVVSKKLVAPPYIYNPPSSSLGSKISAKTAPTVTPKKPFAPSVCASSLASKTCVQPYPASSFDLKHESPQKKVKTNTVRPIKPAPSSATFVHIQPALPKPTAKETAARKSDEAVQFISIISGLTKGGQPVGTYLTGVLITLTPQPASADENSVNNMNICLSATTASGGNKGGGGVNVVNGILSAAGDNQPKPGVKRKHDTIVAPIPKGYVRGKSVLQPHHTNPGTPPTKATKVRPETRKVRLPPKEPLMSQTQGSMPVKFIACDICDFLCRGFENFQHHMWEQHKVVISGKMSELVISSLPLPFQCHLCQESFFVRMGLDRHVLCSHGVETPSWQRSARMKLLIKCGRCGEWHHDLSTHISKQHNMNVRRETEEIIVVN